jgi:hypothetical protein
VQARERDERREQQQHAGHGPGHRDPEQEHETFPETLEDE